MPKNEKISTLRKKLIKKVKEEVKEKYTGRDVHIIKAVNLLEDLDSIFNLLSEQIREWYSVHFPELNELVRDNEVYLKLVFNLGEREKFTEKNILNYYESKENAKKIVQAGEKSIGSDIEKGDLAELKVLCLNALNIKEERKYLQNYIEESMQKLMPNFSALCGGVLGAKLLAKAGSVRKLAFLPSSTLQVIGAEKALFQSLRSGARGPKYGFLFQHNMVLSAKKWNKGKVARCLAGKLSIAAKEDYFGEKDISAELKNYLEKRLKEIAMSGQKKKIKKMGKERHGKVKKAV